MFSQPIPPQMGDDAIGDCAWNPVGKRILIELVARLCLESYTT